MSDTKMMSVGEGLSGDCPAVGVNCDAGIVWLVLETKNGGKAFLNMEWIAKTSNGIIGDIVEEWCREVRDA